MLPTIPRRDDRRRLLALAAGAAGTLWLPRSAWSLPRLADDPFALGVASGSPTHDGIVLWTRLLGRLPDAPVTVRWELARDDTFATLERSGQVQALPELGHSVHVELAGLAADRPYWYRFVAGRAGSEAVSPVGRTRTLPAPDARVARWRLAYASCQRYEHGYFTAWRHLVNDAPDAVLFLGDYVYEYGGSAHAVRTPDGGAVHTLADYRQRYALYKRDADLQSAHAACPWLVTWDDHEVQNDYAGTEPGENGVSAADFLARRAAAYQAYYEHMPLRAAVLTRALAGLASGAELRLHGSVRVGRLATLHLLDTRQYRDRQACTPDGNAGSSSLDPATCARWLDPARSMLGARQEQWLDEALGRLDPGEGWTLLAQSTLFGQRDFRPGPGQLMWNDGWDGYAPARRRLVDSLRRRHIANPVLLGGDIHQNWVGHVKADYADAASANVGVEFCGTSITSRSGGNTKLPERLAENPHFVFADGERKGYGLAEFTPGQLDVALRVVDDVASPRTRIETLARFVVPAGRHEIERG